MIKVALADDEELFVQLLEGFLTKQPEIDCLFSALSGEAFIEKFRSAPVLPDVIIIDFKMRELDGAQTINQIKQEYPDARSIIMSSNYDKTFMGYMLRSGVNAFIPKGISPDHLLLVIKSVYEKGHYFMDEQVEIMRSQIKSQTPKPSVDKKSQLTESILLRK